MTIVMRPLRTAPSLMVANSSSAIATGPVSRTRRLVFRGDLGGDLADRLGRGVAGLERAVVEHRTHLDEAAQLARLRRVALRQDAPGEARRLARRCTFSSVSEAVSKTRVKSSSLSVSRLDAEQPILEAAIRPRRLGSVARSWMSGSACDQSARVLRLSSSGDWNSRPLRAKNSPPPAASPHGSDPCSRASALRQRGGRLARQFRRRRLDHRR